MPKTSARKSERPVDELAYEEALAELESIVEALEEGNSPLEESMKLFERGQALAVRCSALLDAARLKVQKLSGGQLEAFEEEDE